MEACGGMVLADSCVYPWPYLIQAPIYPSAACDEHLVLLLPASTIALTRVATGATKPMALHPLVQL